MNDWRKQLKYDPTPLLLNSSDKAVVYFTKRDILDEKVKPITFVWGLPEPQKILRKQQVNGSWKKSGANPVIYPPNHYELVETFKNFRILVERYQFTKDHPAILKAAEFLFSFQTPEGDIRGFIGNQYATYYTGYVLSLLIKAGYEADPRIDKGINWLLAMRQNDGGWTIPLLTHEYDRDTWNKLTSEYAEPLQPDQTQPFSHNWTDMVLRAFATHPQYRKLTEAKAAGTLLKSSFFQKDFYTSYQSAKYWTRFIHWWPNLITALDVLSLLGFTKDDPDIEKGLNWFITNQQPDGLWKLESSKVVSQKDTLKRQWLSLNIYRVLPRFFS